MEEIHIGWIGLGNMGIPMAEQFVKAGYRLSVYNRSQDKAEALSKLGAKTSSSPKELLSSTDMVVIMVSDDEAISQIFTNENGLLSDNTTGKIIINMSTVSPGVSIEMAQLCKEKGNFYLDAPVSGSVKQAETGTLVIMVGGEEKPYHLAKSILEKLGKLVMHVGAIGSGNNAKLAINSLLALYAQGLAETILFAKDKGIETADLLNLISNAAIGNVFTKIKGDAILSDNYKAAFALKHIVKDLKLAQAEGLATPLAQTALNTFANAEEQFGEEDIISVVKAIKR
ncbi:NAD(P)-dependent oxidoreductase [Pedobacter jejuensis]|uniref:NAD(P)-dependent oxidoreductase n=1 Tax=Pedobacter jejuensis TaxID=1268550 RepID=A0A3N0BX34_9SPHI|nr:NAD(P)-dependent oxidoreductase [Pedobacter jejuensis]RNL54287.1 NAD(P)-dependent oxidoreductase [Pedobacter jejuensis]